MVMAEYTHSMTESALTDVQQAAQQQEPLTQDAIKLHAGRILICRVLCTGCCWWACSQGVT